MTGSREHILIPIVISAIALGGFLWLLRSETHVATGRIAFEDEALRRVQALAAAQATHRTKHGRYGWLRDLAGDPALKGLTVETLDGDAVVKSPRYRIDVLLPAVGAVGDLTPLAKESAGRRHDRLAAQHFAIVARPWGEVEGGWRTFYVDETGAILVNEGVSDPLTRLGAPLPEVRVPPAGLIAPNGMRWWALDDLPPR